MRSYMEMIFVDSEGQARKTDMVSACATNAGTFAAFRSYRQRFDVGTGPAAFLLDYYNRSGHLGESIGITREGFEAITGTRARTEAEYLDVDAAFWAAEASKEIATAQRSAA